MPFAGGFATVLLALAAWTAIANPYILRNAAMDDRPMLRLLVVAATLIAAPLAGAWMGMEIMTRWRPVRAMDHRVRRARWLAVAGVVAGLLSVAGSAAAFPFLPDWLPEAVVTGGASVVFSALALLPFARRRVGHCIHCGYDLRGGALRATCPECGAVGSAG